MREIKFRAWDKVEKKMHLKLSMFDMRLSKVRPDDTHTDYLHVPERADIMQFTGLRDMNGKEIYEGDVIEFSDQNTSNSEPFTVRQAVVFDGGSFYPKPTRGEHAIVIGNIYENPELLEPKTL